MAVFVRPWGQQPNGRYPAWRERWWPGRYKATCSDCRRVTRGTRLGKRGAIEAGLAWQSRHWMQHCPMNWARRHQVERSHRPSAPTAAAVPGRAGRFWGPS